MVWPARCPRSRFDIPRARAPPARYYLSSSFDQAATSPPKCSHSWQDPSLHAVFRHLMLKSHSQISSRPIFEQLELDRNPQSTILCEDGMERTIKGSVGEALEDMDIRRHEFHLSEAERQVYEQHRDALAAERLTDEDFEALDDPDPEAEPDEEQHETEARQKKKKGFNVAFRLTALCTSLGLPGIKAVSNEKVADRKSSPHPSILLTSHVQ